MITLTLTHSAGHKVLSEALSVEVIDLGADYPHPPVAQLQAHYSEFPAILDSISLQIFLHGLLYQISEFLQHGSQT